MKKYNLILSIFMVSLFAKAQESTDINKEESAVNQVIIDMFDGMRAGDSAKVHRCFHPNVAMWSSFMTKKGEEVLKVGELKKFLEAVGTPHDEIWDEKIRNTKISIDRNLAQAWTEYGFFVGEKFSHCGVDAFLMVRTEESWKILTLADTRKREGCDWE